MEEQIGISYQRFNGEPMGPYCLTCAGFEEEHDPLWPTGNSDTGLGTIAWDEDDGIFTCPICGQEIS